MTQPDYRTPGLPRRKLFNQARRMLVLVGLLFGTHTGFCGESTMPEYQVKALFLLNFTKYVDWPAASFAGTNAPIIIGVYGEDKFGDALRKAVEDKTISGRRILLQSVTNDAQAGRCHVLFFTLGEKKRLGEILDTIKGLPVLTVGETDSFMEQGGVINFMKKEGKIRLAVNLDAARQAQLQISSKLLGVADFVKGKAN